MPHTEVIPMDRISVVVPYKLTAWHGKGEQPTSLKELDGCPPGVQVVRGWGVTNVKVIWRGLAARELRKGQFAVWRVNESVNVYEGGVIDTFVTDQLNAILAFAVDFDLDQNLIETTLPVYQQSGLAPFDAFVVPTSSKKGSRRGSN